MKKVIIMLVGLSCYGTLKAQSDATYSELGKRMDRVETIVSKLPKLSGFLNMRYQWDSSDRSNSFDIRRARVSFKGDLSSKLDYCLQVEFASPKILDAYMRYKVARQFNIQAGEFKIPFTMENTYGPHTLETAENSMAISRLCNAFHHKGQPVTIFNE